MSRVFLSMLVLAACSSAEPEVPTGVGESTSVELLGGGFVRFEQERIPLEAFLLEVRHRVRAAGVDPAAMPWIRVQVEPGRELPSEVIDRLALELRKAGVRYVDFGSDER